jgi:predicted O-methyltransferase YrrM
MANGYVTMRLATGKGGNMFDAKVQTVIDEVDRLRHQVDDHWQIPRDEALVLAQLVRLARCMSLCEIGVSYGFSTLHLAAATREHGGHVHAFEINEKKIAAATRHLTDAGLADTVTIHPGDARTVLPDVTPIRPYDFAFIDATKEQSFEYLEALWPRLGPRAMIVTDNTTTHRDELADFVADLRERSGGKSCQVAVGNGFELTLKS